MQRCVVFIRGARRPWGEQSNAMAEGWLTAPTLSSKPWGVRRGYPWGGATAHKLQPALERNEQVKDAMRQHACGAARSALPECICIVLYIALDSRAGWVGSRIFLPPGGLASSCAVPSTRQSIVYVLAGPGQSSRTRRGWRGVP